MADYASDARRALAGIEAIGGVAILVGGTGLYLRAVARGLATEDLPSDAAVRARLEAELAADGLASLVARLRALAPERAAAIDLRNPRRVVRALEIAELAGDAPLPAPLGYPGPLTWVGLAVPDPVHRVWIARRARDQFDRGLIDEAGALRRRYDPTLPAFSAIGYSEAWSVLDGRSTLEDAIERDAARNVAFARRQRTWFRAEPGIDWFDPSDGLPLAAIEAVTRQVE